MGRLNYMLETKKIAAGIVLYNPDIDRLRENISSIILQISHLYLIDNGSDNFEDIIHFLSEFCSRNITLIINKENQGIAKALNQMCAAGINDSYEWMVTLDQDSVCPKNLIEEFIKVDLKKKIGMICPIIVDRNNKSCISKQCISSEIVEVDECITSGSMIQLTVWRDLNGFDEIMFIDGVDFDMCYRLRKNGYKIISNGNVKLLHELGQLENHKFLFGKILVKNHSPFRKYYIARNIIYIAKKRKSIFLFIKGIFQEIKLLFIILLFEENKIAKLNSVFKGIKDGILMRVEVRKC